jgi:hypothetical protein
VATAVIHGLEAVDVDIGEHEVAAQALGALDLMEQDGFAQLPPIDARQLVEVGSLQLLVELLALASRLGSIFTGAVAILGGAVAILGGPLPQCLRSLNCGWSLRLLGFEQLLGFAVSLLGLAVSVVGNQISCYGVLVATLGLAVALFGYLRPNQSCHLPVKRALAALGSGVLVGPAPGRVGIAKPGEIVIRGALVSV